MKKITIIASLVILSQLSFAQDNSALKKMDVSIGLSDLGGFMDYGIVRGVYNLNLDYRVSKHFSTGVQFGYGRLLFYNYLGGENVVGGNIYRYAATGSFHLTPFIIKKENPKLDIYLKGKIGGQTGTTTEVYSYQGTFNFLDYGAYFGVSYNPIKKIGIYGELGYGKVSYSQFGLSFSF